MKNMKKIIMNREVLTKIILMVLCLGIGVCSLTYLGKKATDPKTYQKTIQSLDEKKTAITGVTAASAAASSALAAVPGDATTPIANQTVQMSSYLMIVVCVLVLEKSLITVMGFLAFRIIIPIACGCFAVYIFRKKDIWKTWTIKLSIFAIIVATVIPFSQKISDMIYEANQETVDQVTSLADQGIRIEEDDTKENKEKKSWLDSMVSKVKEGVSDAGKMANKLLNNFIDAIAIFVMTYCIIPILVILIMFRLVKVIFGAKMNVTLPQMPKWNPYGRKKKDQD